MSNECSSTTDKNSKKLRVMASLTAFLALLYTFWQFNAVYTTYKTPPRGLFTHTSHVTDVPGGSMRRLFRLVGETPVCLVVYYSHWSVESREIVQELNDAAKLLRSSYVSFVAINCWVGECKDTFTAYHFPRVFLYHTKHNPIEFLGKVKVKQLINFVENAVRPWNYIGDATQLSEFIDTHQNHALVYIDKQFVGGKRYHTFNSAAIYLINRVNRPKLGMIIDASLAQSLDLSAHGQLCFTRPRTCYPLQAKYEVDSLVDWLAKNSRPLVSELTPNATDSNYYVSELQKGPAILLAYTDLQYHQQFSSLAQTYYRCKCTAAIVPTTAQTLQPQTCPQLYHSEMPCRSYRRRDNLCTQCEHCYCACASRIINFADDNVVYLAADNNCVSFRRHNFFFYGDVGTICCRRAFSEKQITDDNNSNDVDNNNSLARKLLEKLVVVKLNEHFIAEAKKVIEERQDEFSKILKAEFSRTPSLKKKKINYCGKAAPCCSLLNKHALRAESIEGLACRTNRTLSFYTVNFIGYKYILNRVGVCSPASLLIVDMVTEENHVRTNLSYTQSVSFVLDFTNGVLNQANSPSVIQQNYTVEEGGQQQGKQIVDLTHHNFEQFIHQQNNVLVMFYAGYCGVCKSVCLQFLKLLHSTKHKLILARIDAEKNTLAWKYTPSNYPSFVLFPKGRKSHSKPFIDKTFSKESLELFLDENL